MSVNEEREEEASVHTQRAASPGFSYVSMKSNHSMYEPPTFSNGPSSGLSNVSMRSNHSMYEPPQFSNGPSSGLSNVSMRSNHSMYEPPTFSNGPSSGLSNVSMRSNHSMYEPPTFSNGPSSGLSNVSMRSNHSMYEPPTFSNGPAVTSDFVKRKRAASPVSRCVKSNRPIHPIDLRNEAVPFDPVGGRADQIRYVSYKTSTSSSCQKRISHHDTEAALQLDSHQPVHEDLQRVKDQHKTSMTNRYETIFEGIKLQEHQTLLNRIYTQLYIIEGESESVNEEHEVLQMEKSYKTLQDTPINCNDIFDPSPEQGYEEKRREKKDNIKTVLTKGIAGIGKTVSVQKFILDWAEGKANQDVDFMFVLPFRELNLIKDHQYNLHRLLLDFHPELQHLDSKMYDECTVVFIFDGLDESRITLMFSDSEKVSGVTETSSVGVLMSNLMKGNLLPSALIWITTRPAAANQIPSKYINRVTEIQGFNDPQKEEYFRKRISDEHQASRIISHIRRARSLHIMCHIPVFCWISATVLQNILKQDLSAEIPQTLTEMYIHFLLIQINMRNQKYEERDPENLLQSNRDVIVKLAELAFNQLMKGNVMFYEEDLRESGIDVTDASVYSGICTEIFREECVIYHRKVYSFVHLSFQEFFAGLYVFFCYLHKNSEVLKIFLTGKVRTQCGNIPLDVFLKEAMNKALKSENGHLDLFLRFLHGISLESNQRLLQDVLIHTENNPESIKKIIQNLKRGQKNNVSPERWMNLSHCLIEIKDSSVVKEMQAFLNSKTKRKNLSLAQCSTLANMILMSEEVMDELDFMKNIKSKEGRWRLVPAVRNCRKALLAGCKLTDQHCEIVASALQSSNSPLRELDLSKNHLQDSAVKLLCAGLKSPNCQLNILSPLKPSQVASGRGSHKPETGDLEGKDSALRERIPASLPPPVEGRGEFVFLSVLPLALRSPAVPTSAQKEQFPNPPGHKRVRLSVRKAPPCHSQPPLTSPAGASVMVQAAPRVPSPIHTATSRSLPHSGPQPCRPSRVPVLCFAAPPPSQLCCHLSDESPPTQVEPSQGLHMRTAQLVSPYVYSPRKLLPLRLSTGIQGQPVCGYDCVLCAEGSFSNTTGYTIMPPKKKSKRGSFSPQPGLSRQYLMEHFTAVPANHEELKNGHVLLSFISNDHSWTTVVRDISNKIPGISILQHQVVSLVSRSLSRFKNLSRDAEMAKFKEICNEVFPVHHSPSSRTDPPTSM
ncbi:NLR family CARD domain-containing protein 3 [Anabarilius grahami]|uniref:NLR family CARD domain-containing protein 3 n=1 Tax=Anabarilius grahami TaxID=495550 RepID=A0A3N0Z937_ANAGA|nr:NLR family CARD domain-containing protein 3 [Anabarilius grahami]